MKTTLSLLYYFMSSDQRMPNLKSNNIRRCLEWSYNKFNRKDLCQFSKNRRGYWQENRRSIKNGTIIPYPDAEWNNWESGADVNEKFVRTNSLRIGPDGLLWVVDTGRPSMGQDPLSENALKLVSIDIATNIAESQRNLINFLRIAIFVVMAWIGGLKAFQYEADGIVPFVANSPVMSFFYNHPDEYKAHKNKEGELIPANVKWNTENGTYTFAYALGTAIVVIGLLTLLGIWFPKIGLAGGLLTFGMSLVTLSFLITTPEAYVPDIGGTDYGLPYLSGQADWL